MTVYTSCICIPLYVIVATFNKDILKLSYTKLQNMRIMKSAVITNHVQIRLVFKFEY